MKVIVVSFCFSNYLAFFDPLGILFFSISLACAWKHKSNRLLQILVVFIIILFSIGMGFSLFEQVGDALLNFPTPRFSEGRFQPGTTTISSILKYGLDFDLLQIKRFISSALGLGIGFISLFIAFWLWRREKKTQLSTFLINTYLITGFVLSPLLHLGESKINCQQDIILAHENLGKYLSQIIPPDSLVYWDGGNAFTPMVYVPNARIFPPQINDGYTYHIGGDPDILYYFSHWNAELDQRWRNEADIFIIEAKRFANWKDFLTPQAFQEFPAPNDSPACSKGAELRIFQRIP
ncbi:MAG: hypothetical protein UZ14_CFX002001852 [Chloroflexi bacterium OLB14]|nr:MAG: hypothetical protein UZ14_CFX002001852 [Chloroflexi bacterium OLB14]